MNHPEDRIFLIVVVAVIAISFAVFGLIAYNFNVIGAKGISARGTIISESYPHPWYCMSMPNCGYHYSVLLSNGTIMHYVDTCRWSVGQVLNFTYYSKMGWVNSYMVCD